VKCGSDLPTISVHVYEFQPKDRELLRSYQYRTDSSGKPVRHVTWSPPIGIQYMSTEDQSYYEKHVELVVSRYMSSIARIMYHNETKTNDFAYRLFLLLINLRPQDEEDVGVPGTFCSRSSAN
jgi:hypothetical protein